MMCSPHNILEIGMFKPVPSCMQIYNYEGLETLATACQLHDNRLLRIIDACHRRISR